MSRASGLKAVAVVFTRLLNSPATRLEIPSEVEESFFTTEADMDHQTLSSQDFNSQFSSRHKPKLRDSFNASLGEKSDESKPLSKKDKVAGCLVLFGMLWLGALGISALLKGCSTDAPEESFADSSVVVPDKWQEVPLETRKDLCEMKLRDAKELASELEAMVNEGSFSRLAAWKGEVRFVLSEIDAVGYVPGTNSSAMGCIKTALQDMQFAADKLQRGDNAYSSSLKLMRQNLQYAEEWSNKGKF